MLDDRRESKQQLQLKKKRGKLKLIKISRSSSVLSVLTLQIGHKGVKSRRFSDFSVV